MSALIEKSLVCDDSAELLESPLWNDEHIFVDYLSVRGDRPLAFPADVHGDKVVRSSHDGAEFESFDPLFVEGRGGSSYRVRSVCEFADLSFNPSRVDEVDNLFGVSWPAARERVGELFARHGCQGDFDFRVSRVDLTVNVRTGSPENLREYLQQLRYLELPHCEKHTTKYGSVAWHNKAKRLHVYDKGLEIRQKRKKLVPDSAISWLRPDKDADDYFERLAEFCESNGVARVELKLKGPALRSRGLYVGSDVTESRLREVFMKEVSVLKKVLLENGDSLSDAELGVLVKWTRGQFRREDYAKNTAYKYRRNIREATGYDIFAPGPIELPRRKSRVITETLAAPGWYLADGSGS